MKMFRNISADEGGEGALSLFCFDSLSVVSRSWMFSRSSEEESTIEQLAICVRVFVFAFRWKGQNVGVYGLCAACFL